MSTPTVAPTEYVAFNPATGREIKSFPEMTDDEVSAALAKADSCYRLDWKLRSVAERAGIVRKAADILRERAEEYAQLMTLEMGKLIAQARGEVHLSIEILAYYANHAEKFLVSRPLPETDGAIVALEPIGVIVGIEPWNFPYYQIARVAGPQLVAGNVLMLKHAQSVPQCALAFARLFEEAGAPEGVYTNLFCSIGQIAKLVDDFRVRGLTLTGSERAGASVAERAGRNLKKVVLELGGSDPFIVLEDAPLDKAIDAAFQGRMMCMGQACAASKRFIIVGDERGKQFIDGFTKKVSAMVPGDPADPRTTLGPLFAERAVVGLVQQVEEARAAGARVVIGGKRMDRPGFYMEPAIITGITPENPIFQQELFGPVASVYVVKDENEAIEIANATKFGLGSSIFSADVDHAKKLAERVESGMVFINSTVVGSPALPFGGTKNSGFGRELSELGIQEFLNHKLIRVAGV
jgi:succinate-semialdehyde dehydrogenase/glutarate-semialdehyde dehydrogenase